jgi:hypothetical protein
MKEKCKRGHILAESGIYFQASTSKPSKKTGKRKKYLSIRCRKCRIDDVDRFRKRKYKQREMIQ